jgi:hypothetical protein
MASLRHSDVCHAIHGELLLGRGTSMVANSGRQMDRD